MNRLKEFQFDLAECEVGDYGFHLRERWPCHWDRLIMPIMPPAFINGFAVELQDVPEEMIERMEFSTGWTTAGIRIWVRIK